MPFEEIRILSARKTGNDVIALFLSQRNTDHNKVSSLFYTAVSDGYSFPKSLLMAADVVNAQNSVQGLKNKAYNKCAALVYFYYLMRCNKQELLFCNTVKLRD